MAEVRIDPLSGLRTVLAPGLDAVLDPDAPEPEPQARRELFSATAARGAHEHLALPRPVAALADLDADELVAFAELWRARLRAHAGAACRHLWVSGPPASCQLLALDVVPAQVARERERFGAHATRTMGGDLLADLVQEEVKLGDRLVAYDDEAVLLSPYAARAPYALLLAPRTGRARFEDDGPTGARLLHDGLRRLRAVHDGPLDLWIRTAPRGAEHFCWRIDVLPRAPVTGLQAGTGLAVSALTPEAAAARLRDAA
jgi:UDPglucose--hexose-1-phosphate uridylyltransferase